MCCMPSNMDAPSPVRHWLAHHAPNLACRTRRCRSEYRKVFVPNDCALRLFDPAAFDARFAGGRRLILLGDSLMRLHFYSLACLARSQIRSGNATTWARSNITWQGNYTQRWTPGDATNVTKQFVGGFTMASGGQACAHRLGFPELLHGCMVCPRLHPQSATDPYLYAKCSKALFWCKSTEKPEKAQKRGDVKRCLTPLESSHHVLLPCAQVQVSFAGGDTLCRCVTPAGKSIHGIKEHCHVCTLLTGRAAYACRCSCAILAPSTKRCLMMSCLISSRCWRMTCLS